MFVFDFYLPGQTKVRQSTGYKPLAWTMRVQIALDAAKSLEYIHKHTKPYYVH